VCGADGKACSTPADAGGHNPVDLPTVVRKDTGMALKRVKRTTPSGQEYYEKVAEQPAAETKKDKAVAAPKPVTSQSAGRTPRGRA
jgi:hypothetical protein